MTESRCAVPGCDHLGTGIFCTDHYFKLPSKQAHWLVRWQIKMMRCDDADERQYMREQLHGYVREAIRTIQNAEATLVPQSASAAAAAATRPSQAAAAIFQQVRT